MTFTRAVLLSRRLAGSQLKCLERLADAMIDAAKTSSDAATAAATAQFAMAVIQLEHRALQPHLGVSIVLHHLLLRLFERARVDEREGGR